MHHFPAGRTRCVAVVLGVVTVVAGCGGSAASTGPAAPGSATPAAASASVARASAAPATGLSVTWTSPTDGRTVSHPAGWTVREDLRIIYLTSTAEAGGHLVGSGTLSPGEIFIQVGQNSTVGGGTTDPAVHLPDNLKLLIEGSGFEAGAPTPIDVGGRTAARIDASNAALDMLAVSIPVSAEMFTDVIAYTPKGEMAAQAPLILDIVDSLTFTGS